MEHVPEQNLLVISEAKKREILKTLSLTRFLNFCSFLEVNAGFYFIFHFFFMTVCKGEQLVACPEISKRSCFREKKRKKRENKNEHAHGKKVVFVQMARELSLCDSLCCYLLYLNC